MRQQADWLRKDTCEAGFTLCCRSGAGVEEVLAYAARQAELFAGRAGPDEVTSKRLDVIESRTSRQTDNRARDSYFPAEGRRYAVQWLRGESTTPPADPGGYGPYWQGSKLPAMFRQEWDREAAGRPNGGIVSWGG